MEVIMVGFTLSPLYPRGNKSGTNYIGGWVSRSGHYLSTALQPFVGPWPLFQFLNLYTVGRTSWTGISSSQGFFLYSEQQKHGMNAGRHPCLE
jgi:hypothetical protein